MLFFLLVAYVVKPMLQPLSFLAVRVAV